MHQPLKRVDVMRHELKALRYILDNYHAGKIAASELPAREDFQSEQTRVLYDVIIGAANREAAEASIRGSELDDVDLSSFLRLSGGHYYSYPALIKQRADKIRRGDLKLESA